MRESEVKVATLLPDLARPLDASSTESEPISGLVYSDLIALLVAQLQRLAARVEA